MALIKRRAKQIQYLIRLGRPLFLVGGVVFHALGVTAALALGADVNLPRLLLGQLVITAIQLMTHYSNDYFDLAADRANQNPTRWAGGSRVLASGLLPPQAALVPALLLALLAVAGIVILGTAYVTGPLLLPMLLLSLILAWGYSAPPMRLHSRGVGEVVVALLVPGLTTLIGFYLQTGRLAALPFLLAVPLCFLQFGMMLAISFPDAAGDAAAGKRTLVVRWGGDRTARLYQQTLILAYASLPLLVWAGLPLPVGAAAALGLPLALRQIRGLGRGVWHDPAAWNSLAFWSVALLIGTAVLELLGLLWEF